jgi:preprotein translocase subunit YajC
MDRLKVQEEILKREQEKKQKERDELMDKLKK